MDDYTLFSRRRLVPYGQSYAPESGGRFEQGAMRIRQMQRAQEQAVRRAAEIAAEARPLTVRPSYEPVVDEEYGPKVKSTLRAGNIYKPVPEMGNTRPRAQLPSWVANRGLAVAPFNIGDKNSPTLPSFAYADRLEPNTPQNVVDRAIATAKGIPQQVYKAVTSPAATAKAIANAVLSGEDYQSSGEPVVQNGVINWGDPDNAADFFRADKALQELRPYVEPETPPEPADEGYSNGGIVSGLLNEVADFVNPGFAGGGEVEGEYDYIEPEMIYDDEYDYVEPELVEDLDGFADGGPVLLQDEYPTEYMPEVGRQVMADGGMSDRARMRQSVASIQPREGEEVKADGEGWQRALQNYRNFPVRPGEATVRPRDDWRAKAAAVIAGEGGPSYGSELRRRAGEALFGPTYGVGLTDVLALPTVIDAAQAYRKGNTGEAAINAATLGIPFAAAARKPIGAALRTARDVLASPAGKAAAAGATGAAVMSPDDAEAGKLDIAKKIASAVIGHNSGLGSQTYNAVAPSEADLAKVAAQISARNKLLSPLSSDPEIVKEALRILETYKVPSGSEFGSGTYFKTKPPMAVSDVTADISPLPGIVPHRPKQGSWEDFYNVGKGGSFLNVGGDRLNQGVLTSINGQPTAWAVKLHGGPKYMLEGNPGAVWANAPSHTTSFENKIAALSERGPVFGVYSPMGPTAVDSSVDFFNAMMSQIPGSKITKKAAKAFDAAVKKGTFVQKVEDRERVANLMKENWPGILNIKTEEDALKAANIFTSATHRADLMKLMEKTEWQKLGFPNVGVTRAAVSDPEFKVSPQNVLGGRIVEFDTAGKVKPSLVFEHPTYPSVSAGRYTMDVPLLPTQDVAPTPTLDLLGRRTKSGEIMHPMSPDSRGRSSSRKMFTEQKQAQPINEEFINSVGNAVERIKKYGFAHGGPVEERDGYAGGSAVVSKALRKILDNLKTFKDPESTKIKDWQWRPVSDVAKDVGSTEISPHVLKYGDFMREMIEKGRKGDITDRDLLKAYTTTMASIQRRASDTNKIRSLSGLPLADAEAKIRPEGAWAEWLKSAAGQKFLDEGVKGNLSQDTVDQAMNLIRGFGLQNRQAEAMDFAVRNLPGRAEKANDLIYRGGQGASSPDEWRAFTSDLRGIGPAKSGFYAATLGRGDLPTLDARQIILHTGMPTEASKKILGRSFQGQKSFGALEGVDRLAARQKAMNLGLPSEYEPLRQHLTHHEIWDKTAGEKTTHKDIIDAMLGYAHGGPVEEREGYAGRGKVVSDALEAALNLVRGGKKVFPKPERMFPEGARPPGGEYIDPATGEILTGMKPSRAVIGVTPDGKPIFMVDPVQAEVTGSPGKGSAKTKTNLYRKSTGWKWIDVPKGYENVSTLVSAENRQKHYFALGADFPKGVDLEKYPNQKSEPRLKPTTQGNVYPGNEVGRIYSKGKEHPVYDMLTIRSLLPAALGAGAVLSSDQGSSEIGSPLPEPSKD